MALFVRKLITTAFVDSKFAPMELDSKGTTAFVDSVCVKAGRTTQFNRLMACVHLIGGGVVPNFVHICTAFELNPLAFYVASGL